MKGYNVVARNLRASEKAFGLTEPLRILDISVDWMEGWGNSPRLRVEYSKTPDYEALRYERSGSIYRAIDEDSGYASFFAWRGPGNEGGYCGRCFDITMTDGRVITLRGPWSSNSDSVNAAFRDERLVVEISYGCVGGYQNMSGAALARSLVDWLNDHPEKDFHLALVECHHGTYVQPVHNITGLKDKSEHIFKTL